MSGAQILKVLGLALIVTIFVSSCDTDKKASDAYYFEEKEYTYRVRT